jgi:chromosome segregation ATPase
MFRFSPCLALAAGALIAVPLAVSAQSYRCTGKDGKKYYGQTIPDQCVGQMVEQLDKQGVVIRRIENQSAEDKAAKKADEKKKLEDAALKKEEDRRNRALLATYSSEKDIEEARGRALTDNQAAIKETQRRIDEIKKRQTQLAGEMEFYKKNPAPPKLQNDVKAAQTDLEAQQSLLDAKKKEVESINARYDEDKKRFASLTKK